MELKPQCLVDAFLQGTRAERLVSCDGDVFKATVQLATEGADIKVKPAAGPDCRYAFRLVPSTERFRYNAAGAGVVQFEDRLKRLQNRAISTSTVFRQEGVRLHRARKARRR